MTKGDDFMKGSSRSRALLVSLLVCGALVLVGHAATLAKGGGAVLDPEYAKLMGASATEGKSGLPSPAEVGAVLIGHLADPFFDRGANSKGIGIQLAYSLARVLLG